MHFIHYLHKGKGKLGAPRGKRESSALHKGKGKWVVVFWVRIPLGNQTARPHSRTKRSETISQLDTLDLQFNASPMSGSCF